MWGRLLCQGAADPFDGTRILPFLCLLLVLSIRCVRGLDVTDEMQYYGQILGLIESGRLFSSDLFIQQLVYLLFYPAFKLHHLVFGEVGFVLFGRVLLALVLITLYGRIRKALMRLGSSRWQSALAAFAVTFAVPYHGIFALSYNTISQCAWVVFVVWYLQPQKTPPWMWVVLLAVAGFAHPVAALAMGALLVIALVRQGQTVDWMRWSIAAFFGLLLCSVWLFSFTNWAELKSSLVFSRGFGAGGGPLWTHAPSLLFAAIYVAAMVAVGCTPRFPRSWARPCAFLLSLLLIFGAQQLVRGDWSYGYTVAMAQVAGLMAIGAYLLARIQPIAFPPDVAPTLRPLSIAGVMHFLVLVGTSSNGLSQGMGAFMVMVPLACAFVSIREGRSRFSFASAVPLSLTLLLALIHWSVAPYRDRPWYRLDSEVDDVPAFRYLKVSAPNFALMEAYRQEFEAELKGRPALIASERPGLYFALGAHPQTCMLYMHSAGNPASANVLTNCLMSRRPEVILDVREWAPDPAETPLRRIVRQQTDLRGMSCRTGQMPDLWIHAMPTGGPVSYRLCVLRGGGASER